LANDAGCALVEKIQIVSGPPVVEAALCVKLCALIVKAVADFMANHHANAAVIDGVSVLNTKGRRLQYPGRKNDFV
jgi:hypothetical protein